MPARRQRIMSIAACAALMIFAGSPRPAEAQSILKLGQANETPKTGCAGRYHQALAEVKGQEYAAVETAKSEAASGDVSLPGRYLGQEETPFLCGGVPAYLETMRSYLARAGADAGNAEELFQAQAAGAEESIRDALELMKPVPIPQSAPADRGRMSLADLRPAAGIGDRSEVIEPASNSNGSDLAAETDPNPTNATAQAPETATSEPAFDPDLPPLKAPDPIPLRSDADRLQALTDLMGATERGNFLPDPTTTASFETSAAPGAENSQLATIRPVLARLQELRPLVYGARPAIRDLTLRRALIQSFWAIEVLDYLDHRPAEAADSVPSAIGRTLSAIETAHRANCGCD